jgi:hypothetical protein
VLQVMQAVHSQRAERECQRDARTCHVGRGPQHFTPGYSWLPMAAMAALGLLHGRTMAQQPH